MSSVFYQIACIVIPCLIYQIYMIKTKPHMQACPWHIVWSYIFFVYLFLVFSAVGTGSIWDIGNYNEIIRLDEINLIPFQSDGVITYVLNIIMFIPLGFLLPFIWKKYQKVQCTVLAGAAFSFTIECCQLFNQRISDIDDLLMNTLGAFVGYLLWMVFQHIFHNHKSYEPLSNREAEIYLILAFLGQFLLYNWRLFLT